RRASAFASCLADRVISLDIIERELLSSRHLSAAEPSLGKSQPDDRERVASEIADQSSPAPESFPSSRTTRRCRRAGRPRKENTRTWEVALRIRASNVPA